MRLPDRSFRSSSALPCGSVTLPSSGLGVQDGNEDLELSARSARGDQQAFALLVAKHERALRSFLLRLGEADAVDDIAQEAEFLNNPGSNANFGKTIVTRAPDPNIQRAYNMEYSIQLQRELVPRVSVTLGYFRRVWKNVEASDNTRQTRNDWLNPLGREFQVPNPLVPGQMLKAYELNPNPAVRGQSFTLDYTDKAYRAQYDGVELSYRGLFGDAWLACALALPGDRQDALEDRAGRWCAAVVTAVTALHLETRFSANASGICSGDSGGPLLLQEESRWAVAGVISAASGTGCTAGTNYYVNLRHADALAFVLQHAPEAERR